MLLKCVLIVRCGKEVMQRSFQLTTPPRTCAQLRATLQAQDMRLQDRTFDVFASCSFVNHNTAVQLTSDATVKSFFGGAEELVTLDVTISAGAAVRQPDVSSYLDDELVTLLIYPPLRDGLTPDADITEKTFVIPITGVYAALCRAVRDTVRRDDVSLCRVELFSVDPVDCATTPIGSDLDARQLLNRHAKEGSPCRLTYVLHPRATGNSGGEKQTSQACRHTPPKTVQKEGVPQHSTVAASASPAASAVGTPSSRYPQRVDIAPVAAPQKAAQDSAPSPAPPVAPTSMQLTISQPELDEESSLPRTPSSTTPPTTRPVCTTRIHVLFDAASDVHEMTFVYIKREPAVLARLGRECTLLMESAQASAGGARPTGVRATLAGDRPLAVISGGERHNLRTDADLWEWLALSAESGRPLRVQLLAPPPDATPPPCGPQAQSSSPTPPPPAASAVLPISVTCVRVSTPARSPPHSPSKAGNASDTALLAATSTMTPPAPAGTTAGRMVLPELKRRPSRGLGEEATMTPVTTAVGRAHAQRLPEVQREGGTAAESAVATPRPSSTGTATPSSLARPAPPRLPVVRAMPPATPEAGGETGPQAGTSVTRLPVVRSPREGAAGSTTATGCITTTLSRSELPSSQTPPLPLGAPSSHRVSRKTEQPSPPPQQQHDMAADETRACSAMCGSRAAAVLPLSSAALAAAAGVTGGEISRQADSASCPAALSVAPPTADAAARRGSPRSPRQRNSSHNDTAPLSPPPPLSAVEVQPPRERRPSSRLIGVPRSRGGSQAVTPSRQSGARGDGPAETVIALSATEISPTRRRKATSSPSRGHGAAHGELQPESWARASESAASEAGSTGLPPVLTQTCAAEPDVVALITDDGDGGGTSDGWPVQVFVRWGTFESLAAGYARRMCLLQDVRQVICGEFGVPCAAQALPRLFMHEVGDEAYSRTELAADEQLLSALQSLSLCSCSVIEVKPGGRAPLLSNLQPVGMRIALAELIRQLTCQLVAVAHETKLQDLLMACEPYTRHIADAARFFQRLTTMPEAKMAAQHQGAVELVLQRCLRDVHDAAGESLVQVCNACVRFANTDRPASARRHFYARLYYALQRQPTEGEAAKAGEDGEGSGCLTQAVARRVLHPLALSFSIASQAETLTLGDWVTALAGVHATEPGPLLDAIALARARAALPVRNFRTLAPEEESVLRDRLLEEVRHCFDGCTLASLESFVQHPAPDLDLPQLDVLLSVVGCLLAPRPTRQYARWMHDHFYGDEATTLFTTMRNFQSSKALPLPSLYSACWEMLKPDLDYCLLAQKADEAGRLARWAFFAVQMECLGRNVDFPPVPPLHSVPTQSSAVGAAIRLQPARRQDGVAGASMPRDGAGWPEDRAHGHDKRKTKVHYKYVYHCGDLRTPRVFVPATHGHASKPPVTSSHTSMQVQLQ